MRRGAITRESVVKAIAEHDELGRDAFLLRYGFGEARSYVLLYEGREYDSKAIAGVAHKWDHGRALTRRRVQRWQGPRGHLAEASWLPGQGSQEPRLGAG